MVQREKNSRNTSSSRLPPLNALRAFETAARHLSMTRAAEELNVTHGAVSQHVRQLEAITGAALFERSGNRLRLTPAGTALLQPLRQAFDLLTDATRQITTGETGGEVMVSAPPALATLWLVRQVGALLAEYPALQLRLVSGSDTRPARAAPIDLAIRYGDGRWPAQIVEHLSDVYLMPVCSPDLVAGKTNRRDDFALLEGTPLLCADNGDEWDKWLSSSGRARLAPGPRHYLGNALTAIEMAAAGFGIAIGDNVTTSRYLADGRLVCPIQHSTRAANSFYLVTRPESETRPAVILLRQWIRDSFAAMTLAGR